MFWVILLLLAAAVFFVGRYRAGEICDFGDWFFFLIVMPLVSLVVGLLVVLGASSIVDAQHRQWISEWVEEDPIQIVSLREGNAIGGTFLLGTGSSNSKDYYYFYIKNGHRYQLERIPVGKNVTIIERDTETGTNAGELKISRYVSRAVPGSDSWFYFSFPPSEEKKYEFQVPKGTVVQDFPLSKK